jgi:hypothetical protein
MNFQSQGYQFLKGPFLIFNNFQTNEFQNKLQAIY